MLAHNRKLPASEPKPCAATTLHTPHLYGHDYSTSHEWSHTFSASTTIVESICSTTTDPLKLWRIRRRASKSCSSLWPCCSLRCCFLAASSSMSADVVVDHSANAAKRLLPTCGQCHRTIPPGTRRSTSCRRRLWCNATLIAAGHVTQPH